MYGSEIREHYFDETNVTENLSAYTTLMSDVFFLYGIDKAVKTQAKISSGKTYYYKLVKFDDVFDFQMLLTVLINLLISSS